MCNPEKRGPRKDLKRSETQVPLQLTGYSNPIKGDGSTGAQPRRSDGISGLSISAESVFQIPIGP
jgi:hypothetical protein